MKLIILLGSFFYFLSVPPGRITQNFMYTGAWQNIHEAGETICMMDGYFVYSKFNKAGKSFDQTWGGPYLIDGKNLKIKVEFDSKDQQLVGKEKIMTLDKMKQVDDG